MKIITIYLDSTILEVHNSIMGKEIIKINGNIVSSKYSILGGKHAFEYQNNKYTMEFFLGISGVQFDLYKNEMPILEVPRNGFIKIITFILGISFVLYLLDHIF